MAPWLIIPRRVGRVGRTCQASLVLPEPGLGLPWSRGLQGAGNIWDHLGNYLNSTVSSSLPVKKDEKGVVSLRFNNVVAS